MGTKRVKLALWGALGLLLLPLGLAAQTTDEGYDPMIQIMHQFAHPNIYVLLDTTGSMAWDKLGNSVGTDSSGDPPDLTWSGTSGKGCGSTCKTWIYTLNNSSKFPSRLMVVKNALGNSVDIWAPWDPPKPWPALSPAWLAGTVTYSEYHDQNDHDYTWTVTYSTDQTDPGPPFTAYDPTTHRPTIGTGGIFLPAQDLIGVTANQVNWGFITFHGQSCNPGGAGQTLQVPIDTSDSGDVTDLEQFLRPAAAGGTSVGGATNLKPAVLYAAEELRNTYDSDPRANCGRTFATIVVTDGLSNQCNPNDGNWISPCGTCPGPSCCDTKVSSDYQCPSHPEYFPPGSANDNWITTHNDLTRLRTWAIGISKEVYPCEINMLAYMGRTDADSPNGDSGFTLDKTTHQPIDPYLPQSSLDASRFDSTHQYAYFGEDSGGIRAAFMAIVAAVAAGDYTTSAPVASSALTTANAAVLASTEFPSWRGHLYTFDIDKAPADHGYLMWDGGWNLSHPNLPVDDTASPWVEGTTANPGYVAPADRKIYTWDSSNTLVPVTSDNLSTLNTICGSCSLTAGTIDFIRGNNGSGVRRSWVLGSIVNSTPAITQKPETFIQGNLENHKTFEDASASPGNRAPLVWVGSDDGMLHAFRLDNGKEVLALLPPNLLTTQNTLYQNFLAGSAKSPTGQPTLPSDHLYGIAGSVRYGDMYDSSAGKYRTVMLLTEGPGGKLIAGFDVTDPVANLAGGNAPVTVLWSKVGGSDWPDLNITWSTPAGGAASIGSSTSASKWIGLVGEGFNPASSASAQLTPKAMVFNPLTGILAGSYSPAAGTVSSPSPYVGNQTFADAVLYAKTASAYYPDNIVDLGVQADLNGRIWFLPGSNFNSATVGIDATTKAGQQQPLYYSPAVNAFTSGSLDYDLYVFGSGTVYEKSPRVTGINVGKSGYFIPNLYLVTKDQDASQATADEIAKIPIQDLYKPEDLTASPCDDPANQELVGSWKQRLCSGQTHVKVGLRTQLTAPPALFVPASGTASNPTALFLIYDPDDASSCAGISYIVKISFNVSSGGAPSIKSTDVYGAGEGAASGFAVAGNSVIIAKSSVGEGARAGVSAVPNLNPTAGFSNPTPVWWREVK